MKSSELAEALAPFLLMANKHALSLNYKVLDIGPSLVRCCSAFGILEAEIALGAADHFVVDTTSFIAVIKSLPDDDVEFEVKGDALHWQCGLASGKLALVKAEVKIPEMPKTNGEFWSVTDAFVAALSLGGLSCGDSSLATAGAFGIVLDNRSDLTIRATDDITISACTAGKRVASFPDQTVISPDAAKVLSFVLESDEKPQISIGEKAIYLVAGAFRLLVRPIPALKQDLAALGGNFASKEVTVSIPHERIAAFIKRATALAESARHTYVDISAEQGALSLAFSEDKAASEEYYLAEGLDMPWDMPPVRVDAGKLARALAHTDTLVLDHVEKSVLVLAGSDPEFSYMISGKKGTK